MPANIPYLALQGFQGGQNRALRRQELAETMQRHREEQEQRKRQFEASHALQQDQFGETKRRHGWEEFDTLRQRYPFAQAPGPQQQVGMPYIKGRGIQERPFNPNQLDPEQFRSMIEAYQRSGRGGQRPASGVSGELGSSLSQSLLSRRMQLEDKLAGQAPQWANVDINRQRLNWQKEKGDKGDPSQLLAALAGMGREQGAITKRMGEAGVDVNDPAIAQRQQLFNAYAGIAGMPGQEGDPVLQQFQQKELEQLMAAQGQGKAFGGREAYPHLTREPSAQGAGPAGWFAPGSMSRGLVSDDPETMRDFAMGASPFAMGATGAVAGGMLAGVPGALLGGAGGYFAGAMPSIFDFYNPGGKPPPYKKQGPARGSVVPKPLPPQVDPYAQALLELDQIQKQKQLLREGAQSTSRIQR